MQCSIADKGDHKIFEKISEIYKSKLLPSRQSPDTED